MRIISDITVTASSYGGGLNQWDVRKENIQPFFQVRYDYILLLSYSQLIPSLVWLCGYSFLCPDGLDGQTGFARHHH